MGRFDQGQRGGRSDARGKGAVWKVCDVEKLINVDEKEACLHLNRMTIMFTPHAVAIKLYAIYHQICIFVPTPGSRNLKNMYQYCCLYVNHIKHPVSS